MADPKMSLPAPLRLGNRTNYARGARFERKVADALTGDGYRVWRAAGSHGKADLVALKRGETLLIQCKLGGPAGVRPAEWNELHAIAAEVGATALVASRPVRGKILYLRVLGPKVPRSRTLPASPWTPDQLNGDINDEDQ